MIFVSIAGVAELLALVLWLVGVADKIDAAHIRSIVIIPVLLAIIPAAAIKIGFARVRSAPFLPERGGDGLFMVLIIANAAAMLAYGIVMTSGF